MFWSEVEDVGEEVEWTGWNGVERGWVGANCSYWRSEELLRAIAFAPDIVTVLRAAPSTNQG